MEIGRYQTTIKALQLHEGKKAGLRRPNGVGQGGRLGQPHGALGKTNITGFFAKASSMPKGGLPREKERGKRDGIFPGLWTVLHRTRTV